MYDLQKALTLAPSPRKLFFCSKCRDYVQGVEVHVCATKADSIVVAYCHGEVGKFLIPHDQAFPMEVFCEEDVV